MQPRCSTRLPPAQQGIKGETHSLPSFRFPLSAPGDDFADSDRLTLIQTTRSPRPGQGAQDAAPPGGCRRYCSSAGRDLHSPPALGLPLHRLPDRVLFETAYGALPRAAEVCGLYLEDLDVYPDDKHVRIHGTG